MRKILSALLVILVVITVIACGGKKEGENLDKEASLDYQIRMDPLPFKNVMNSLETVANELVNHTPTEAYRVSENVYEQSFAIGVISADAVLAISSRDEEKLKGYTELLIEYSKNIGLQDEILKMADEIMTVLSSDETDKWITLEKLVINYQTSVEMAFYDLELFDQFTLMQLGGWTEGLHRISALYMQSWDGKGVKNALNQKGIINSLVHNLNIIESSKIKEAKYYQIAIDNYEKIKEIIYSVEGDEIYSKEDVKIINELATELLTIVQK